MIFSRFTLARILAVVLIGIVFSIMIQQHTAKEKMPNTGAQSAGDSGERAVITLAGGCFWCSEGYLQGTEGVVGVISGYAGGTEETATYEAVGSGTTAHREAVQVTYDPKRISLKGILDVFWAHIDPTDDGGQFTDRGTQYRTAIFYQTEEERQVAEDSKERLAASGLFDKPIVTEILPFTTFFPAEEYHQDYFLKSAAHYERYKKGSGRAGFVEETWAKDAAREFLASGVGSKLPRDDGYVYVERSYTPEELAARALELDPLAYQVLEKEGTEPSFNNAYWDNKEEGIYVDAVTGRPVFSSTHKYDSGTGWPSFWRAIDDDVLTLKEDRKLFTPRVEMRSEGGHVGHVFDDGPQDQGGKRYCANSAALTFIPKEDMVVKGYSAWLYLFDE